MDAPVRNAERDRWDLKIVDMLPWASASDLARCSGRSAPSCYQAMAGMEESGDARCCSVSTGGQVWRRVVLSDGGRAVTLRRHQPEVVMWCCGKLEMVAGTYRLLGDVVATGRGRRLEEFRWEPGGLIEGLARFSDGWCAVLWSGWGETLGMLRRRLSIASDRGFPAGAWPGMWFVIVPDRLQADLVTRAAGEAGLEGSVLGVGALEGLPRGVRPDLRNSVGWYGAARRPAEEMEGPESPVPGGVWMGGGASRRLRVLWAAEQWPGADGQLLLRLSGCGRRGFGRELANLVSGGLLDESRHGGFVCGEAWRAFSARRDGVGWIAARGPLTGRWRRIGQGGCGMCWTVVGRLLREGAWRAGTSAERQTWCWDAARGRAGFGVACGVWPRPGNWLHASRWDLKGAVSALEGRRGVPAAGKGFWMPGAVCEGCARRVLCQLWQSIPGRVHVTYLVRTKSGQFIRYGNAQSPSSLRGGLDGGFAVRGARLGRVDSGPGEGVVARAAGVCWRGL